ncbi:cysteine desulfurase-like protein [Ktedonobacter racemifer]|uniref:Cysteine desulfurase family protein n=1 Tax=Ktedonobacter racemifer DSM 44963 TaxID=485913 RepID=D6TDW4_KTERA|nr:cysteine desulfurase-like protein [Ktedonobacter racemifer]EFH90246.1 cysteine desulfurase family protein [Ktedonobacter racemifer DSM 44963]
MLDIEAVRSRFPSLNNEMVFFDNPGGTQIAQDVLRRMQHYLLNTNANHGGAFTTSLRSDSVVYEARQAMADFLNAARPEEIVFGQNMTSLTLHISRSLALLLQPGDEIVVTRLDHDANIAPWLLIARDRGCTIRWVDIHPEDCTLDMQDLERQVTPRTKLVAIGYASNAVGTINDVKRAIELAHQAGALCFIDAVQYAPHRFIDVQELDCDLLACSGYKFFGPHIGILYGKYELLQKLEAYKVRPADNEPPEKFETGTQSFESIAGLLGCLEYLAWLGTTFGASFTHQHQELLTGRRLALRQAMEVINAYESELSQTILQALTPLPGLKLYGIADPQRLQERVPTFSFSLEGWRPRELAEQLAVEHFNVWDGNYYAVEVMTRLGLEEQGGLLRVGLAHYNTHTEIERLGRALSALKK